MKNVNSVKVNTILNAFRMALTVFVPLITFPYTSRIFLTEGSGQLNFANSVVQIFILFASLGIYTYGVREGTKVRHDKELFSQFAIELLLINFIATTITYIVFIYMLVGYSGFEKYQYLLIIYGISIGFTALGMDWVYGVYEEYLYITIRQIIIQVFAVICMFLFVNKKEDVYVWAWINVFTTIVANIYNFVHAKNYISYKKIGLYIKKAIIKPHIQPILVLFATVLASKVYQNLDTILLGVITTDHNTGIYSAAVKINTIVITCFTAMSPVFMPRIIKYVENHDDESYLNFLKKILQLIFLLGVPCVIGMIMTSDNVIYIVAGEAFYEAGSTMRILAPIVLLCAVSNILYYDVLVVYKKENWVLWCTAASSVVNLVVSIILIPVWKQNGAAVGSLLAELLAFMVALRLCFKVNKALKYHLPSIGRYLIGSVLIVVWCLLVNRVFYDVYISFIIKMIGSIVVYTVFLCVAKDNLLVDIVVTVKKRLRRNN